MVKRNYTNKKSIFNVRTNVITHIEKLLKKLTEGFFFKFQSIIVAFDFFAHISSSCFNRKDKNGNLF